MASHAPVPIEPNPSRDELELKLAAAKKTIAVLLAKAADTPSTATLVGTVALERAVALKTRELEQERATLAQLVAQWKALLDNAPDIISRIDPNGVIRWTNGDVADHHWSESVAPEFRGVVAQALEVVFQAGKSTSYETSNRSSSGELRWQNCRCSPIWEKGKIVGAVVVERDCTETKLSAEKLAMAQTQLAQTHKLAGIGQLAAGVAHEINTPTQYATDNLTFLDTELGSLLVALVGVRAHLTAAAVSGSSWDAARAVLAEVDLDYLEKEIPRALSQSLDGLQRIGSIVSAMKDFSHPSNGEHAPADLRVLLETTSNVARNEWKLVAALDILVSEDMPQVPVVRDELTQAILNLIVNAAHAIEERSDRVSGQLGRIRIAVTRSGRHAEIRISDDGAGIPAHVRRRIFEPFFTTKGVGKGTGQGLAIAYDVVVNKHGGTIDVDSEVGSGTTFTLRIPLELPRTV